VASSISVQSKPCCRFSVRPCWVILSSTVVSRFHGPMRNSWNCANSPIAHCLTRFPMLSSCDGPELITGLRSAVSAQPQSCSRRQLLQDLAYFPIRLARHAMAQVDASQEPLLSCARHATLQLDGGWFSALEAAEVRLKRLVADKHRRVTTWYAAWRCLGRDCAETLGGQNRATPKSALSHYYLEMTFFHY
jgi:hypothetical protein